MADEDSQRPLSESDDGVDDATDSGDDGVYVTKRARVVSSRGRQPVFPADVVDAMIMLRIEKEKQFLKASDGRTRHTGRSLWIAIAAELKEMFGGRKDVSEEVLNQRALGKKWSYIESTFKVRAIIPVSAIAHSFALTPPLPAVSCITEAKRRCSQAPSILCARQRRIQRSHGVLPWRAP
jgi:hypothetical protein